ncbi:uncharacterized protein [Argopecten irradians]|uniref:uncharacterized protein n=1 Tax=Argopecten irradians TaxID=31199 RepID=UPI0037234862
MKVAWVAILALTSLLAVSADEDETCPYGWYIHVHRGYVGDNHYVTTEPMNSDYVRIKMIAEMGAFKHKFIRDQMWALDFIPTPEEDPIVLRKTCKTHTELITGFWETSASYCYIILPGLQNVRRARCDRSESCCKSPTICYEDGYARHRYWVYCAHYSSPFNGYYAVRYDTFPQCCTCRRCDKCIDPHH